MFGTYSQKYAQAAAQAAFRRSMPVRHAPAHVKQYNTPLVADDAFGVRTPKHPLNTWFYKTVLQKSSTYFVLVGVLAVGFDAGLRTGTANYVAKFNAGRSYNDVIATFPEIPPNCDDE